MPSRRSIQVVGFLRSLFAAGGALLVLTLAVFAVSPKWHHDLHEDGASAANEGCAIDLFAHGVSLALGTVVALPAAIALRPAEVAITTEIFLAPPRYLRQPERGPPALG